VAKPKIEKEPDPLTHQVVWEAQDKTVNDTVFKIWWPKLIPTETPLAFKLDMDDEVMPIKIMRKRIQFDDEKQDFLVFAI